MTRVLVVEDEQSYREALAYMLRKEGFEVVEAADGTEGLAEFDRVGADIVLLDQMMPGLPGTEVCRQLRTRGSIPVIMVTARDSEVDKVVGLELGADDYVTKPFSPRELLARVRAMLRRPRASLDAEGQVRHFGALTVDIVGREVHLGAEPVELTRTEFDVLAALAVRPRMVFARRQLIEVVWGEGWVGDERLVDVHIGHVRRKLGDDPANPVFVRTVRGVGYRMGSGE